MKQNPWLWTANGKWREEKKYILKGTQKNRK